MLFDKKNSVVVELGLKITQGDLPIIKGFAFGTTQPLGTVSVDITLDFIKARIDVFAVSDEFLNTDLLIGQNVTEASDVIVYKTNKCLVLYSDSLEMNKAEVYNLHSTTLKQNLNGIEVRCGENYTGLIYIPGNASLKEREESITLPGVFSVVNSVTQIPIINLSGRDIFLKEGKLLARAQLLLAPELALKTPTEFEVNKVTISNEHPKPVSETQITLDMLNVGPDVTDEQRQTLL